MASIPILSGVYTSEAGDFTISYPVNLIPIPVATGISGAYLRPADGIVSQGSGPGITRGAINWNGVCYRVMGSKLCSIDASGNLTILGDVGLGGQCALDYSFDRLAISSNGNLFYWDGTSLAQVTDPDLGTVLDVVWVDGYFMTTDGENLVVTELADPFSINPLKYGSSEADPDPVMAVLKLRNEIFAVNRYTTEVFNDVGGTGFPFSRNQGGQIQRGAVGTFACCVYSEAIAFVGGGRNEAPSVYIAQNGVTNKVSTRAIDILLSTYSEHALSLIVMESKVSGNLNQLWIRLPDRTIVFDIAATGAVGEPVWFTLTSSIDGFEPYRAKDLVWCYDKWLLGDGTDSGYGELTQTLSTQWGVSYRWEFGTGIAYNQSMGAIFHRLELVALTGRIALGDDPQISTSYSEDGETWSQDKLVSAGKIGNRQKRLVWYRQGKMRNWRVQRFRGDAKAFLSFARLEVQVEPLAV